MTWQEWAVARQVVAEEFVGGPLRNIARAEQEAEDAQIEATKAAIRKTMKVA
jgi:hypothetical protein